MRLQVLYLPDKQVGDEPVERRFGLVLDDCGEPLSGAELGDARQFAASAGAAALWVTSRKVEVDQGDSVSEEPAKTVRVGGTPTTDDSLKALRDMIRVRYNGDPGTAVGTGGL